VTRTSSADAALHVTLTIRSSSSGQTEQFISKKHAEIRLTLKPEYAQHMSVAHGGIVSYAADTALAFAGGSVLRVASGAMIFTSEYKINYV
jgi:uncharacterized protein (TIGR00369 family)